VTLHFALLFFAGLSMLSCDAREGARENPTEARPAAALASVGGSAIEASDLAPDVDGARHDPKRQLEAVIARKLASAEARRRNLDTQPDVVAKLEAIHRGTARSEEEVLREVLFASLRDAVALTDEELRAHYEKTKLRFAERQWRLLRERFATEAEARGADARLGAEGHLDAARVDAIGPATAAEVAEATSPEVLRLQRPGQRTTVSHDGAYELVELVEMLPAEPKPFDAVRAQVEASLRTLRAQAAFRAEIERLRAAAKIEIDEEELEALRAVPRANEVR
jgi:hypothetical protein